jgi:uncharacterized membrane protein
MVELRREARDERIHAGRVTDMIARRGQPSSRFTLIWFADGSAEPYAVAFDPYPFSFLNLVVVLEAGILTSNLLTQNHMTQLADRRAALDL